MEAKKQTIIGPTHIAVLIVGMLLGAIIMAVFQAISEREYMGKYIKAKVDLIHVSELLKRKNEFKTEEEWHSELEKSQTYISENYYRTPEGQKP